MMIFLIILAIVYGMGFIFNLGFWWYGAVNYPIEGKFGYRDVSCILILSLLWFITCPLILGIVINENFGRYLVK